ncbi:MAG: type II toxin-antitoxin system RelE/ParE family toxin [Pseudomonadota bacterium]
MNSIEFHPEAETEFAEATLRYQSKVPGLGVEFEAEVRRAVGLLQQFPELGARVAGQIRHLTLRRFKHSVIYVAQPESLLILAIAHGSRDQQYWLSRAGR